jgi:hypothetical protein
VVGVTVGVAVIDPVGVKLRVIGGVPVTLGDAVIVRVRVAVGVGVMLSVGVAVGV